MKIEYQKLIQVGLICFLVLSACVFPGGSAAAFEGQTWELQYYRKTTAVEGANAAITFSDGVVSGSTGCNFFSGEYTSSGEASGEMQITNLAVTEMACLEPEGLMDQEAFFLETLNGTCRFEYSSDRLMIYQSGHEALTFKLQKD